MNCNIEILLITQSKYRDVCCKLAMFYKICLLYENVTFYTYDILDMSRINVRLIRLNKLLLLLFYVHFHFIGQVQA
jgi:hypothetical protein